MANWHYIGHWPPQLSDGLLLYGVFVLILAVELLLRRYWRKEARHAGAVVA